MKKKINQHSKIVGGKSVMSPLNAFSFIKTGINDSATVKDPSTWSDVKVTLIGNYKII